MWEEILPHSLRHVELAALRGGVFAALYGVVQV
jgi:hypothetical protein